MPSAVVTFGEIMLRLQPPGALRFVQTDRFEAVYGGGEANVAASLAQFGQEARFVTRLPHNPLGEACLGALRRVGVDTRFVARGGDRLGIYFCEKGHSQRPSVVVYDRAGSAIATAGPGDFDWEAAFERADWFHFTGITPALSEALPDIVAEACRTARRKGLAVSCDLNYRKKLWSRETASRVMTGLMEFVDLLVANEEDAADVFGIQAPGSRIEAGHLDLDGYAVVARTLSERFGIPRVAMTLRESLSASDNGWSALLLSGGTIHASRRYAIRIVDRVGSGDSFGAGLIHALRQGQPDPEALEFAVAASCLKHTIEGDMNLVTEAEVDALVRGGGSGRVQR